MGGVLIFSLLARSVISPYMSLLSAVKALQQRIRVLVQYLQDVSSGSCEDSNESMWFESKIRLA
jgi:hypothetical protein